MLVTEKAKCHYSCLSCLYDEYDTCITCNDSRQFLAYDISIGECICFPGLVDIGETECIVNKGYLNTVVLSKSFYSAAIGINLFTTSVAMNPLFYLGLSEFTQSVSYLSYVN